MVAGRILLILVLPPFNSVFFLESSIQHAYFFEGQELDLVNFLAWPKRALLFPADEVGPGQESRSRGRIEQARTLINGPLKDHLLRLEFALFQLLLRIALLFRLFERLHALAARDEQPLLKTYELRFQSQSLKSDHQAAVTHPRLHFLQK